MAIDLYTGTEEAPLPAQRLERSITITGIDLCRVHNVLNGTDSDSTECETLAPGEVANGPEWYALYYRDKYRLAYLLADLPLLYHPARALAVEMASCLGVPFVNYVTPEG